MRPKKICPICFGLNAQLFELFDFKFFNSDNVSLARGCAHRPVDALPLYNRQIMALPQFAQCGRESLIMGTFCSVSRFDSPPLCATPRE